jgi:glycosyltransferase involved in cell wall biosynthesis
VRRSDKPIRVLYSFPHKIGARRICYTAWQQVACVARAGAEVLLFPGVVHKPLPSSVEVRPTLSRGRLRISYKLLGKTRPLALHDYIVSRRIKELAGKIDIVHVWPSAALQTLKAAARLGIPTVLERPNAHTRYAYESVQQEARRIGIDLPPENEYAFREDVLAREEEEFRLADYLLCPSEFTMQTFVERGFKRDKLIKHQYGFDEGSCYPDRSRVRDDKRGLTMLFVGDCAVRKGVHFALAAWLKSPAHQSGQFLIAGEFLPAYAERLSSMLSHPSVHVLGYRSDVPELMRKSDILVLPSIEEGFPLVCNEAMGSGSVPIVSEVCIGVCKHMENALVHRIGDVETLTSHITMLHENRDLLAKLRAACLRDAGSLTWSAAGVRLLEAYSQVLEMTTKQELSSRV